MSIEIFVGDAIDHASERIALEHAVRILSTSGVSAILIANVQFSSRQIDLIVATEHLTLVLEAKAYTAPVRGTANGHWQVRLATGSWKDTANLYRQTVEARHALRDAMRDFGRSEMPYPEAALVFTSGIPSGSSVFAGDFKASIVGLEALPQLLRRTSAGSWSLPQWRAFAEHHQLTPVGSPTAALDPILLDAEQTVFRYTAAFRRHYQPVVANLVPYPCTEGDRPLTSDDVVHAAISGESLLVVGPSGCGKSMVAFQAGLGSVDQGRVPIVLYAKDFAGRLKNALDLEVALLDGSSAAALVNACDRLGRPITLIVDGVNESPDSQRERLTRCIAAACRRYLAPVIITTSVALARPELLNLRVIDVGSPTLTTKQEVARGANGGVALPSDLEPLLASVASGLEARLVGSLAGELPADASQFALFDGFVRKRLGKDANRAIRALAAVAGLLTDRISFSLTVRDLGRLADTEDVAPELLAELHRANLLVTRGDRTSFAHELYLNAFAAEAVIRRANGSPAAVADALRAAIHADRTALIVGAIDDHTLLSQVLSGLVEPVTFEACLKGQCGPVARGHALLAAQNIIQRVAQEIEQARFEIDAGGFMGVRADPVTLTTWSPRDCTVLAALPMTIGDGILFDEILALAAALDRRLLEEYERLVAEARERRVALRGALFANGYGLRASNALAISEVWHALHNGFALWRRPLQVKAQVRERLWHSDLTAGQLYVLLTLHRHASLDDSLAPILPRLLRTHWPQAPYHLRLDLMLAAQLSGRGASDADRAELIQAIEELPQSTHIGISSAMIDALKSLGALDESEDEHTPAVRQSIREVLSDSDNPDMQKLAFGIWNGQFDHPYDGAYYQAIAELPDQEQKSLLVMAARGADWDAMFLSVLIAEIANLGDPSLGSLFTRWTAVPDPKAFMPQDALGVFARAHIALARLTCPLPVGAEATNDANAQSMAAAGRILYWLNRLDLSIDRRRAECAEALGILTDPKSGIALSLLREFAFENRTWIEGFSSLDATEPINASIGEAFPEEMARICRHCLHAPDIQRGYFQFFDRAETLDFAISALGYYGTLLDLDLLRQLSRVSRLGRTAVAAIARIEKASRG